MSYPNLYDMVCGQISNDLSPGAFGWSCGKNFSHTGGARCACLCGGAGQRGAQGAPGSAAAGKQAGPGAKGGAAGDVDEGGDKEAPPPDNRTWLQKNWIYFLPVAFMVMPLLTSPRACA